MACVVEGVVLLLLVMVVAQAGGGEEQVVQHAAPVEAAGAARQCRRGRPSASRRRTRAGLQAVGVQLVGEQVFLLAALFVAVNDRGVAQHLQVEVLRTGSAQLAEEFLPRATSVSLPARV